jgi:hypothetical protein
MKKQRLQIAHQVPGRIRMKVQGAKDDPQLLEDIKATFQSIPGIGEVTVNPATGSIVLNYDAARADHFHHHIGRHCPECAPAIHRPPANEIDQLAQRIEDEAEFLAERSEGARAVVDFFKSLDRQIKVSTGNAVDLKIVLAAGVIGVTIFEVGATAATPVWVTIAIFGMNHLAEMHPARGAAQRPATAAVA